MLVPRGFVARMRKGDAHDPLLRQVWPFAAELAPADGFSADPVREQGLAAHGVIQKYPGRVLLIASGACPLHCRYCFRREFPYQSQLAARADWSAAIAELRNVPDATEAILSGGDPLSLSNRRLGELLARIADTAVTTLRIHTRFPIAIPERVDDGLLRAAARHAPADRSSSSTRTTRTSSMRASSARSTALQAGADGAAEPVRAAARRQRRRRQRSPR